MKIKRNFLKYSPFRPLRLDALMSVLTWLQMWCLSKLGLIYAAILCRFNKEYSEHERCRSTNNLTTIIILYAHSNRFGGIIDETYKKVNALWHIAQSKIWRCYFLSFELWQPHGIRLIIHQVSFTLLDRGVLKVRS